MSVFSVQNPDIPVSTPDELESFFHVLLYLALRYLCSSLRYPRAFIDDYFESSGQAQDGRTICGALKQNVLNTGRLLFQTQPVSFLSVPQPSSELLHRETPLPHSTSPLNELIQELLDHFKAHYDVRKYNAAIQEQGRQPAERLPSLHDAMKNTPEDNDGGDNPDDPLTELLDLRKHFGDGQTPARDTPTVTKVRAPAAPETKEPSDEEKKMAASLATHKSVKDLFLSYIMPTAAWPSEDYIGDQLKGYVRPETTADKRPRIERIPEGEEDVSVQPDSSAFSVL